MRRLNPAKLHITYLADIDATSSALPRRYTLTHSDISGELFLSIGTQYDIQKISGLYTRLMRDEVLAELVSIERNPAFKVYCHVSGGFVLGSAKWRYNIFKSELPLVLEAFRFGDRTLFEQNSELDKAPVQICFDSTDRSFNRVENWGIMGDHKLTE